MSAAAAGQPVTGLEIVCVVPMLNEAEHLTVFLSSLAAQLRPPDLLVLVDDGSSDASPRIAGAFAATRDNVTVLRRAPRPPARDRLGRAAELRAFQFGLASASRPWDLAVKLDADLKLSPDLFLTLERTFLSDPRLGIAGTYLSIIDGKRGATRRERNRPEHVRGATKFYRSACYEQIGPLEPILGWDTIDEVSARAHGWRTASLSCPAGDTIHMRPTGGADGRLRAQYRWGMCAYAVGQHPLWLCLSAARRAAARPPVLGALAFVAGVLAAASRRQPRAEAQLRAFARREQSELLRRRARSVLRWFGDRRAADPPIGCEAGDASSARGRTLPGKHEIPVPNEP